MQAIISWSSVEAEYQTLATTLSELSWLSQLLQDFDAHSVAHVTIYYDNQAAIHIANNPTFMTKQNTSKYIAISFKIKFNVKQSNTMLFFLFFLYLTMIYKYGLPYSACDIIIFFSFYGGVTFFTFFVI